MNCLFHYTYSSVFATIKLSKTHLSKIIKSDGFLGRLLGTLLTSGLPLMKNELQPLARSVCVLISLVLGVVASAADAGINKKVRRVRNNYTNNEEMEDVMKVYEK